MTKQQIKRLEKDKDVPAYIVDMLRPKPNNLIAIIKRKLHKLGENK